MYSKRIYGTIAERFWPKVNIGPQDQCWEWQAAMGTDGYGRLGHNMRTHRLAWELTYGAIPDGLWVLHHCDNRACVNPDHLFLGTALDNTRDMIAKGRQKIVPGLKGERNPTSKLTLEQVREIRERYARGENQRALGREFGVSKSLIGNIVRGEAWKGL